MSKNNKYREAMAESKERLRAQAHTVPTDVEHGVQPSTPRTWIREEKPALRPVVVRPLLHAIVFTRPADGDILQYDEFHNRYNGSLFWILRERITNRVGGLTVDMIEFVNDSGAVNCVSVAR